MAQMEIKKALAKLKLGAKKDPNNLLDKWAAIKCRYNIDLDKSPPPTTTYCHAPSSIMWQRPRHPPLVVMVLLLLALPSCHLRQIITPQRHSNRLPACHSDESQYSRCCCHRPWCYHLSWQPKSAAPYPHWCQSWKYNNGHNIFKITFMYRITQDTIRKKRHTNSLPCHKVNPYTVCLPREMRDSNLPQSKTRWWEMTETRTKYLLSCCK
jgi:hypothetical protein